MQIDDQIESLRHDYTNNNVLLSEGICLRVVSLIKQEFS